MQPRILVSGSTHHWQHAEQTGVRAPYIRALVSHGMLPLIASPYLPAAQAPLLLEGMAGLLLTGGEDIDPSLYGATPSVYLEATSPERDAFELTLLRTARTHGLPVLAICRGAQLVNVALGGTLWQDLPSERAGHVPHSPGVPRTQRTHGVHIAPGSRLYSALATSELDVNSIHHQGIRELAPGLIASAWSGDGLVEGIESGDGGWLLGVQWHPEDLAAADGAAPEQGIFRALADALNVRRAAA